MEFVKINEEGNPESWPVFFSDIKAENPSVSFPTDPEQFDFTEYGYQPFVASDKPEFNSDLQQAEEIDPIFSDGVWTQSWSVTEKYTGAELTAKTQEVEVARNIALAEEQRRIRDRLLLTTDWVVIKATETGQAVDLDMLTYRQALRDIPAQAGFPNSINWPTEPE